MAPEAVDPQLAHARVAEIGGLLGEQFRQVSHVLHAELTERIPELQGDSLLLELLTTSIESNVETLAHVARYDVDIADVSTPFGAREYARRLAQHGISPTALIRAYRLGQQVLLEWALAQIRDIEEDLAVAYAAAQEFIALTFQYIDRISEQVVLEYETEREKWLAHRSTVRTEVIEQLLTGDPVNVSAAEQALGHRLRQHHLGAVVWSTDRDTAADMLAEMQRFAVLAGRALGLSAAPLFQPRDRTSGWVWFPLGRLSHTGVEPRLWCEALEAVGVDVRVALGTAQGGVEGFRATHGEALRAQRVALVAGDAGGRVVSYSDPGVRTAAMLAVDLPATRRLVASTLGGLARDTDAAARLRSTLAAFLAEKGSFVATAERMQLHKNTVKYRVDKAVALRGRPVDDHRLELELGLLACTWLGPAVLSDGS